ncbi:uncharacterized protein LOC110443695 [Mizuhopecten yessoensis]|uniref:Uncharacterized protein n=1 Tax=Mizuhopecten yessoensis TaxID=6573 RepID=A0A210PEE7_MIZYE|nr:uncharacterized protein LOC110443695 [Mizuhopecten yessoensis]OWF34862.1 hypothetical protein KP79_PYT08551 [Mizuhopecten yessoensis]
MAGEVMELRMELQSHLSKFHDDSHQNNLINSSQQEINALLKRLLEYLENTHDVEKSLTELPDIGQFLGRLLGNLAVRGNKLIYQSAMMCVMALYQADPSSRLEQKAKDWALAQLQSSLKKKTKDAYNICSLGISHTKMTRNYIGKLSTRVLPALKERIGEVRVRCVGTGTHIPGEVYTEARATLQQIVDVLLSVARSDEYQDVWTDILWILSVLGPEEPWIQNIYQMITSQQSPSDVHGKGGVLTLNKAGYKLLWRSYLPSLEATVLDIIDQTYRVKLPSSVKQILRGHFLLEACSEDPSLLLIVSQMLQELTRHAGGNSELNWVIAVFYQLVQEHGFLAGTHSMTLSALYPEHLQGISTALSKFPIDGDVDICADSVCRIVTYLENHQQRLGGKVTLQNGMLFLRHWYLRTIRICLHCQKKFLDGCSSLLSWILEPTNRESQKEIKVKLHNCIQALRSLMSKVSLEVTDVLYVIQREHNTSDVTRTAIGHLVMMFLFKATAGMHVFRNVLPKVSLAETPFDNLVYMLMAQEELEVRFEDWSPCQLKQYCNIVQGYLQQASCDNLNSPEIFMSTTIFLQKYNTKFP